MALNTDPRTALALDRLLDLARQAQAMVIFTGAGMSTESGIPDYRSPGGVWTKIQPPTLQEFLSGSEGRRRYWDYYREFFPVFQGALPNQGHRAIARLFAAGRVRAVITQNIDGLHQAAGLPADRVWELHGNAFQSACLYCGRHQVATAQALASFLQGGTTPDCPLCGGPVKPCTISFGQSLDPRVLSESARLCAQADLLLVVGSSLAVTPAAEMPKLTLRQGGRLAIINQQDTHLDCRASAVLRQPAAEVLAWLAGQLGA